MTVKRYTTASLIDGARGRGSSKAMLQVREGISSGRIKTQRLILQEGERLDQLAGDLYDDSSLWWVLAAASGIGWGLQVPPGTMIVVPDIVDVAAVV